MQYSLQQQGKMNKDRNQLLKAICVALN
jgi:hypothetical protein